VDKLIDVLVVLVDAGSAPRFLRQSQTSYIQRVRPSVAKGVTAPGYVVAPLTGGIGLRGAPQVRPFGNEEVLDALAQITGQDFKFDQAAWRAWWRGNKNEFIREYEKSGK
jgi:hypothetical protein